MSPLFAERERAGLENSRRVFAVKEFYCIFFINKSGSFPGGREKLAASFSETFVNVRN